MADLKKATKLLKRCHCTFSGTRQGRGLICCRRLRLELHFSTRNPKLWVMELPCLQPRDYGNLWSMTGIWGNYHIISRATTCKRWGLIISRRSSEGQRDVSQFYSFGLGNEAELYSIPEEVPRLSPDNGASDMVQVCFELGAWCTLDT